MEAHILGNLADQPECEHPAEYWTGRDCWVDARAPRCLRISRESNWGWCVRLVTQSHDPRPGQFGTVYGRLLRVDRLAFVAAHSVLYNCHIGEGAVVAVGSVVNGQIVEPWTMVAGNPARVIMRLVDGDWAKVTGEVIDGNR